MNMNVTNRSVVRTSNYYAPLANLSQQTNKTKTKSNKATSPSDTRKIQINPGTSGTANPPCNGKNPFELPFYSQRVINGALQPFDSTLDTDNCFMITQIDTANS